MNYRTQFLLLCALCVFATPLFAQRVAIGGTTLDLGSSRGEALAVANAHFNVVAVSDPNRVRVGQQYMLFPKQGPMVEGRDTYGKPVGTLTVREDRLARISRNLGSFRSEDGEAAIQNMISAFAAVPSDGEQPAVRTDSGVSGEAETSRVYFTYPDRAIQVVIYRPANRGGLATIDISEQYALRDNPAATATR